MSAKRETVFSLSCFLCFFSVIKELPLEVRGFCHFTFLGSETVTTYFETCFVFRGVLIDGMNWCLKGGKSYLYVKAVKLQERLSHSGELC